MRTTLMLAALIATPAFATKQTHQQTPPPPTTLSAEQTQQQQQAQQQAAKAAAEAEAAAQAAAAAQAGAVNEGITVDAGSAYRHSSSMRALALSLPGIPGAPAVGGHKCLEHRAVTQVLGSGKGGRTELNADCLAHEQCMERVDRYIELGLRQQAAEMLAACGGVAVPKQLPPPYELELEERFRRAQGK